MANRTFHDVQSARSELKLIPGRFLFNGTSSPATTYGKGFTIARTGVGVYTITLQDRYAELESVYWGAGKSAAVAWQVSVTGNVTGGSATNTLSFTYLEESAGTFAAADPVANAANWLSFTIAYRTASGAQ